MKFDFEDFYDRAFIEILDFTRNFYVLPARKMPILFAGEKNVIPVSINFPLHSNRFDRAYVINIDANSLFNHITSSSGGEGGMIFRIVDKDGMILASTYGAGEMFSVIAPPEPPLVFDGGEYGETVTIGKNKFIASVAGSAKYDWRYIHYAGSETLFVSLAKPLRVVFLISVFSLAASFLCSVYVSKKFYKPLGEIVTIIGGPDKPGSMNEYDYIKNYLNSFSGAAGRSPDIPREEEEKLLQSMVNGDAGDAGKILARILEGIKDEKHPPVTIRLFSARLLNVFFKIIIDLDLQKTGIDFNKNSFFQEAVNSLFHIENYEGCRRYFDAIIGVLGAVIIEKHKLVTNKNVFLMKQYIDENYDKMLSLDIIADYIKINPSYAGRVFKKEMNVSIVDYINNVRINKAVELMRRDLKINDLARMAGFTNTTYFIQIFKKLKGMTPKQYRETLGQG
jgi:AraC-like DNA-binding protein